MLNSLEDKTNPYRAVFAVDKLNEGWDVLNLFDIVRLYETRDGKNGVPGKTTMKEAQLIGRGARYCPFKITEEQEKYQRKYDNDIDNPLRICETLNILSLTDGNNPITSFRLFKRRSFAKTYPFLYKSSCLNSSLST